MGDWKNELKIFGWLLAGFLFFYFLPMEQPHPDFPFHSISVSSNDGTG